MVIVPPSVKETAFNCPHCNVFTQQTWLRVRAQHLPTGQRLPPEKNSPAAVRLMHLAIKDDPDKTTDAKLLEMEMKGRPFLHHQRVSGDHWFNVHFVNVVKCFNCDDISIWQNDQMIYPERFDQAPQASPDTPAAIADDYAEAASIVARSPRGAAALLRLCIQKLMVELNQPGKNINDDIKTLVASGLDPRVQRALDALRVIGNNAVHPGQIDLKDDAATAQSLFRLFNLIIEKLITEPKHVDEVYAALPAAALAAIEARDKPKS